MSLPQPGSDQYMPNLIRTLLDNPALEEWRFDPNLFSLLLLGLIVRKGGVILDALPYSSSQGLLNVADATRGICESIFGFYTHHLHLDPSMSPLKMHGYIRDFKRPRNSRSRKRIPQLDLFATPQSELSGPRPRIDMDPSPQSGVSTRYHSAESLVTGGPQSGYATPVTMNTSHPPPPLDYAKQNKEEETTESWPDVLIVTGLEDCESPLQIKLFNLVKLSKLESGQEMLVIWVRDEEKSGTTPAWLADNFVLSDTVVLEDLDPVPDLPRQSLVSPGYIKGLTALLPYTHIHASITQHLNNLISAASTHPNLHSSMTARFFTTLPLLVKAHRLLSSPYDLPSGWSENLARSLLPGGGKAQRFGLGGGQGGVNDWPRKAGEEPNVGDLGAGAVEWYVGPDNVRGIWPGAVGHRVKWRTSGESVMWTMKSSAAGLLQGMRDEEGDDEVKRRKVRAKRRKDVKIIVDEMLEMV